MRYIFVLFAILSLTFLLAPQSLAAQKDREPKEVKGKIRNAEGKNAQGASVVVQCGSASKNDTTGNDGRYSVVFDPGTCLNGNTITVVASLNGASGSRTSTATLRRPHNMGDIVLSQAEVPEFGLLTGSVAVAGSLATYLALKKKALLS